MPKKKEHTFESALKRLEEIVTKMETGDITLDESIKAFEEGQELVKFCLSKLENAEARLKRLEEDAGGNFSLQSMDDE